MTQCAIQGYTPGIRCLLDEHPGTVHEFRDSTGKYQWCIDECGCWRWSLYDPAEDGEQ